MAVAVLVDEVDPVLTQIPAELRADMAREEDPVQRHGAHLSDPVVDRDPADWIGLFELDRKNPLPSPDGEFDTRIRPGLSLPRRAAEYSGSVDEWQIGESLQIGVEIELGAHDPYSAMS
jgi:hypothetical protein